MRRFVSLVVILLFSIPFGLSIAGCGHHGDTVQYCNGSDSGPIVGQLSSLQLSPSYAVTGESLNFGQIGSFLNAKGQDCKGNDVNASLIVYGTTDMSIADINPTSGQVCAGTFNRNTGAGIADYTFCTPPSASALKDTDGSTKYLAYVTATASGIVSNAIAVYVHPTATNLTFGQSATRSCPANVPQSQWVDPDTTCCPADPTTVVTGVPLYNGFSCVSQNDTRQIAARIYATPPTDPNHADPAYNITCSAGHLRYGTQGAGNIVALDQNGVATAIQPGSVSITAALSNSSSASSIGFFSTCPPVSIALTPLGTPGSNNITESLNNTLPFNTTVLDANGHSITGLALNYESTGPQTIPASGNGAATPILPGTATITAKCAPPACNPSEFSQIGYLGNGKPVTSNGLTITAPGSSSTALVIGSTQSQYLFSIDFSTGLPGALVKLPFLPNSMVISQDGTTVFLGSTQGLMSFTTASSIVSGPNVNVQGKILSISPDGGTLVVVDAARGTTSLVASGAAFTSYGAIGTRAAWTPDSQTVYITTATDPNNPLAGHSILTHSNFTNWQSTPIQDPASPSTDATYNDVAVMVPSIGAYFAGAPATDGRSYCSLTTQPAATTPPPNETNFFSPVADREAVTTDRIAATDDGQHILGASIATGVSDLYFNPNQVNANQPNGPGSCTYTVPGNPPTPAPAVAFTSAPHTAAFTGIAPTQITGVFPNSASNLAFITFTGTTPGTIPFYLPSAASANGTIGYFSFADSAAVTAPLTGVWATDDRTFYVGTAGDNLVHLLTITYPTGSAPVILDSSQLTPNLPDITGTTSVAPNLIVQRPRKVTSGS